MTKVIADTAHFLFGQTEPSRHDIVVKRQTPTRSGAELPAGAPLNLASTGGGTAVANNPFNFGEVFTGWKQTQTMQAAWSAMTLLKPQLHTVVGLMLMAFPTSAGKGSDRIHAPHASMAHACPRGPVIEEVLPHQDNPRLTQFPNELPGVLAALRKPAGFQQHEMLRKDFLLPGQRPWQGAHTTPEGRPAHRLTPEDVFHFTRSGRVDADARQMVRRVNELLTPEGRAKKTTESLSPVALFEMTRVIQTGDDQGLIVYPSGVDQNVVDTHTGTKNYGFLAEVNRTTNSMTLKINTQSAATNHALGALPPVDADMVVNFAFTKVPEKPAYVNLHPCELRVRHVTELANIVNDAIYLDQQHHTQVSAPVIDALSKQTPALKAVLDQGYQLAGLFDESDDGPGLLLVRK